ncbi:MAG: hypothetical protein WDM91_17440 [Rhizomicrobium sp.]
MNPALTPNLVLAVHPTTRGYGWILFDGPGSALDWGIVSIRRSRSTRLLTRFERILARNHPETLVLEDVDDASESRGVRATELSRSMLHLAHCAGMRTSVFPRSAVRACFAARGATTRAEVARAVADEIPALRPRLPAERKPWMPEGYSQSLFNAAAVAITYYVARYYLG